MASLKGDNMHPNSLKLRNSCAEDGIEMTPAEADRLLNGCIEFKKAIDEAVEQIPNFYRDVCNKTTSEKLREIKLMKEQGQEMTLKEYNEISKMIKYICESQGDV